MNSALSHTEWSRTHSSSDPHTHTLPNTVQPAVRNTKSVLHPQQRETAKQLFLSCEQAQIEYPHDIRYSRLIIPCAIRYLSMLYSIGQLSAIIPVYIITQTWLLKSVYIHIQYIKCIYRSYRLQSNVLLSSIFVPGLISC